MRIDRLYSSSTPAPSWDAMWSSSSGRRTGFGGFWSLCPWKAWPPWCFPGVPHRQSIDLPGNPGSPWVNSWRSGRQPCRNGPPPRGPCWRALPRRPFAMISIGPSCRSRVPCKLLQSRDILQQSILLRRDEWIKNQIYECSNQMPSTDQIPEITPYVRTLFWVTI